MRSDSGEGRQAAADALMRELSVAQAIVDVVDRHSQGRTVIGVEIRVGRSRGVSPATLDFAFSLLTEGTALDGTELQIAQVAGTELSVEALRLYDDRERREQISAGLARLAPRPPGPPAA
ncbi:MAG TPA: hydrogenase maturation nickel metallochaperone HypA [Solirubrobacteraceae bacterium]|jgi:hydrogenase nickel incorporation protein HypA/HybF|nr:hydrogenase maturation nickel metallochaperone HypA [Solirubrobacteraceae bacterium]